MRLNPFQTMVDWNRAKRRAEQIAIALENFRREQPAVTGIEVDMKDPIEMRAAQLLLEKGKGLYSMSTAGLRKDHVMIGYDNTFGHTDGINALRSEGTLIVGGTMAADRFFSAEAVRRRIAAFGL